MAGSGKLSYTDGQGAAASFLVNTSLDIDSSTGSIYTADTKYIRKVTPSGYVTTLLTPSQDSDYAGIAVNRTHTLYVSDSATIYKMDTLGNASVFIPATAGLGGISEIRVDRNGNLVVSNGTKIFYVTTAGVISPIAGTGISGDKDGSGSTAQFNYATGLAIDAANNIYVADQGANKIKKITHK